jgi:hypothetical protein
LSALLTSTVECKFASEDPRKIAELQLTGPTPNITISATFEEERTYIKALFPLIADKVSRIEFLNVTTRNHHSVLSEEERHRGATFYDKYNHPLFFVKSIVLGYEGMGHVLLRDVCDLLRLENGTYERIIRMAQENTQHYAVIVTLQR